MKLTKPAIRSINQHCPDIKLKLASALRCSVSTINRYLKENNDNLTKAAALEVIRRETGLTDEKILEKRNVKRVKEEGIRGSKQILISITIDENRRNK